MTKKNGGVTEPNPYAVLSVGNTSFTSICEINTTNPHWDENFVFVVDNVEHDNLILKINDKKTEKELCQLEVDLMQLLDLQDLSLERQYDLKCPGYTPKLSMGVSLKVNM